MFNIYRLWNVDGENEYNEDVLFEINTVLAVVHTSI